MLVRSMKYSININQIALAETKLGIKDAAILDYLKSFCMSDDKKVKQLTITEKGIDYRYTWINFNHLIGEMPLLRIKNKASISQRIKKIEEEGFIKIFRAPDRNLYVRLMPKIKELEFSEGVSKNKQGVSLNKQEVFAKTNSTNNILIKHNYNNTISKDIGKQVSYGNPDINSLMDFLKEKLGGSPDGTIKENRRYAYLLLKRIKKDYPQRDSVSIIKFLIQAGLQDNFHGKNLTSFKYLYKNAQKIIQTIKGRLKNPKYIKLD